jgi:hypothetical protein
MSPHRAKQNSYDAPYIICGKLPGILLFFTLCSFSLSATAIQYQVTSNGTTGTYQYFISGFVANQPCPNNTAIQCSNQIDIQFDPTMFVQISNGVAPAGFNLLLFQPNNPPQAPGDYSALALVNNPSLAGPFSVDFTFNPATSSGVPCSSTPDFCQKFSIKSFDSNGFFEGVAEPAPELTTPLVSGVPEPASLSLSGAGLIIGVLWVFATRKRPNSLRVSAW